MGGAGPPVAPPGLRGNACDAFAEASNGSPPSHPLPPPPSSMLRSTIPRLFLSLPPWRIPNNPPRDLPPRRLLFLSRSFVSFLPLTFSLIQQFHGSCHQPPYRFGALATGPPLPSSTLLIVTEGCDLCYTLRFSSPCRFGVPTIGPPVPLSTLLHFTEGCDLC